MFKKINNRVVSCFIALTMIFGLGVTVSATGENPYLTIDLTQYQNAVVFGTEGTAIPDADFTADKYPSNQPVDINSKAQYALNKTVFEAVKTSGFIYSADNIPYDVNTNGAVMLGCNNIASKEIVMPENYYDNITFLICNGFTMSQQVTALVTYADNSTSSYVFPTVSARSWSLNNISGNQSYRYITGNSEIKQDGTRLAWNEYYPTYSIPIANKYLKVSKIKLSTTQRYNGLIILGVTGKLQTESEIAQHLVEHLPDASGITSTNYYTYISSIEGIQGYIDIGVQLSTENAQKFQAVACAVDAYASQYNTIDLTNYQNATVFADAGESVQNFVPAEFPANAPPDKTDTAQFALNKTAFDSAKVNGLIYTANGTPYDVNSNGGVMLGCNDISSVDINIPENYYSGISFLVANSLILDGQFGNMTSTVTYTDGSKSTHKYPCLSGTGYAVSSFVGNESYFYLNGCAEITGDGAVRRSNLYYPSYAIPVNANLKVCKISLSMNQRYSSEVILGVTGIYANLDDNIESLVNALSEQGNINITNAYMYDLIQKQINAGGSVKSSVQTEYQALSQAFQQFTSELNTQVENQGAAQIYVSTSGNDTNSASLNSPIKSIEKANDIVTANRGYLLDNGISIDIVLLDGHYNIENTINIDSNQSGKSNAKVTYKGEGNASISRGIPLNPTDFTLVTNAGVLSRMPNNPANSVYEMDLSGYDNLPVIDFVNRTSYINLVVNDVTQQISQYPNNGYTKIGDILNRGASSFGTEGSGNPIFTYTEERGDSWASADNAYVEGYFSQDYHQETLKVASINAANNSITISNEKLSQEGVFFYSSVNKPRRYRIVNLIEELDNPGEWYFDQNTRKLYYYPENIENINSIELVFDTDGIINVNNASNISFENLTFKNSGDKAIDINICSNISVNNCNVYNIFRTGIKVTSATGIAIDHCVIHDCAEGILLKSGNFDTLVSSNNTITNNAVYNIDMLRGSIYDTYGDPIAIEDVGCEVMHNEVYNAPGRGIDYGYHSNDNRILYNEIHDVCKEQNDVSAIYAINTFTSRGTEVAYNYIHDIYPSYCFDENTGIVEGNYIRLDWSHGIYLDYGNCGSDMHNNIIKNSYGGVYINVGQYNKFNNNTLINVERCLFTGSPRSGSLNATQMAAYEAVQNNTAYMNSYPEIETGLQYNSYAAQNNASNNLIVNTTNNFTFTFETPNESNGGAYNNNIVYNYSNFTDFNDALNNDYRIKDNAQILGTIPNLLTTSNFNMSDIGIQEQTEVLSNFKVFGVCLKDSNNNKITDISSYAGAKVNIVANYQNDNIGNIMVCALYNNNNLLALDKRNLYNTVQNEYRYDYNVPENTPQNSKVKIFFWDGFSTMKPIGSVWEC